jgi:hypothetical protein
MHRWPLNGGLLCVDSEGDPKFRNLVIFDYSIIVMVTS